MKKWLILYVFASFILFLSASPWEGLASVAPDGELPATGFFAATNSFPVNTVVDITNIETGGSARVIVAKGLRSADLIAVISIQAAEIIGMRAGAVYKVKIEKPASPIAYTLFTEGSPNVISGYPPGEEIASNIYSEDAKSEPVLSGFNAYNDKIETVLNNFNGPGYTLEPEWQHKEDKENPVTIIYIEVEKSAPAIGTGESATVAEAGVDGKPVVKTEEPATVAESAKDTKPTTETGESADKTEKTTAIAETAKDAESTVKAEESAAKTEEPVVVAETAKDMEPTVNIEELFAKAESAKDTKPTTEAEESAAKTEITSAIAETTKGKEPAVKTEEPATVAETVIKENQTYNLVPAEERAPSEGVNGIRPENIIPAITNAAPEKKTAPEAVVVVPEFSFLAPAIKELTRGCYYVQLAAFLYPELINDVLNKVDKNYRPVVYKDGDNYYRVLLGPFNQGESAAVLARFKSIGFNDAFVRYIR